MFVDCLKCLEAYLCWSEAPVLLLREEDSLEKVTDWLDHRGKARRRWSELMVRFSNYIGYRHEDF